MLLVSGLMLSVGFCMVTMGLMQVCMLLPMLGIMLTVQSAHGLVQLEHEVVDALHVPALAFVNVKDSPVQDFHQVLYGILRFTRLLRMECLGMLLVVDPILS